MNKDSGMPMKDTDRLVIVDDNGYMDSVTLKNLRHHLDRDFDEVDDGIIDLHFRDDLFLGDGQGTEFATWIDSFRKWGVRTLEGNNDKGYKKFTSGKTHQIIDGKLVMRATPMESEVWDAYAGMISTEASFSFLYGSVEVECNVVRCSTGHHLSGWLLPVDGSWPPEIDMFEFVNNIRECHQAYHWSDEAKRVDQDLSDKVFLQPGMHVHRIDWGPEYIEWYVDGKLTRSQAHHGDCNKPMYFLMSWEVGSKWPGPVGISTRWPAEVQIKRVTISPQE